MKKIKVSFNLEVPEEKFDKACFKAMCGKKEMTITLKDKAEIHGRVAAYEFIEGFNI